MVFSRTGGQPRHRGRPLWLPGRPSPACLGQRQTQTRPSPEPRPPTQRWLRLEPGAEPGPQGRGAARAAGPAPAPQPRCPAQDGRAQTLTVGDVTETLGVQQVPQPRHLILQLADQLVVGVLVDDGVTADLLGPVRIPGRQRGAGGCAARRPRAPGAPPAPNCRGISDRESPGPLTYRGACHLGKPRPREGKGRGGNFSARRGLRIWTCGPGWTVRI